MSSFRSNSRPRLALAAALLLAAAAIARANPPVPANDTPATAQVIGPAVPAIAYGTNNGATNAVGTAGALTVAGPDVFYSFTPSISTTYRVELIPWQRVCLRSSDRQFTVYVLDQTSAFVGGLRAASTSRATHVDVALTAGQPYTIGVDYQTAGNLVTTQAEFTLIVDTKPAVQPDTCATAEALSTTLPTAALNDIDGAAADYTMSLTNNSSLCGVANSTSGAGNDHVYSFTPVTSGSYAFELVHSTPASAGFNPVLYISDACPPGNCLGASNNNSVAAGTQSGSHEMVAVSMQAGNTYYVYVDNGNTPPTNQNGGYALIVDTAAHYEITEIEPNNDPNTASPVNTGPAGGQIVGPQDQDWWKISGVPGDRIYAYANDGGASNSSIFNQIDFFGTDGATLIEYDDDDSSGAPAPDANGAWNLLTAASSGFIAGAAFTGTGDHFLRVRANTTTGTMSRYRLHYGVEPAGRTPAAEAEPNDSLATASFSPKRYYSGAITSTTDVDFFKFQATAGDQVFIALDGDPERDSTGGSTAYASDPRAFVGNLTVIDPIGDNFFNAFSGDTAATSLPDYPGMGCFFVAPRSGMYAVRVAPSSTTSHVGPEKTYNLAIFLNNQAPVINDGTPPVVNLTPNFNTDTIAVSATDNAAGDTGICTVAIALNSNLQITGLSFSPGDPAVSFTIALVNGAQNGGGNLQVTDCAGNVTTIPVKIDVTAPVCSGTNRSKRTPRSLDTPIHVPDNNTTGIAATINVPESGVISDVNVTLTIEQWALQDLDVFLESPTGTMVELFTDRWSSLDRDLLDVTLDDAAALIVPITSVGSPVTGTFKPEDALGMARFNGENAQGTWTLHIMDDSTTASGGAHLVRWSLDIDASFAVRQRFDGLATDAATNDSGIQSIVMSAATNTQLALPSFTPGAASVAYTVSLVDTTQSGSCTITVTDQQGNTCQSLVSLAGAPDTTGPSNTGTVTTDIRVKAEAQLQPAFNDQAGVVSTIHLNENVLVGEVEVQPTIDTEWLGEIYATLSHNGQFASLMNRLGQDERFSVGLAKDNAGALFDDDAPVSTDAHLEPASGAIEFRGLHQPDGRGDFPAEGINSDRRDNMLFRLANTGSAGDWELRVGKFRAGGFGASSPETFLRRWEMTIKSPCGPERYYGTARDLEPGTGINSINLVSSTNLVLETSFTPGARSVDYVVYLANPALPGSGTVAIGDAANNFTNVPIILASRSPDQNPPVVSGTVAGAQFNGAATDNQSGDTGVAAIDLAPWADNLQIVSVSGLPAASATFTVGLVNPAANGRGYVRVTDGCGWRSYALVYIESQSPVCTGTTARVKRYFSGPVDANLPDNNATGITSTIAVFDTDIISDVDITFNILHAFDDDIDMTMISPIALGLFTDIGSTGNDFIDTTLDDEAATVIPDVASAAPFTGSFRPEDGTLSSLDGLSASGGYTLKIVDDAVNNYGTFKDWSLRIESPTFPLAYDGRASDNSANDSGIASVALLPGATNLLLTVDPAFTSGARIVRYLVERQNLANPVGSGTVRVTDLAGNVCDVPIQFCLRGDANNNGVVDMSDTPAFVSALLAGGNCQTDMNADGAGDGDDIQAFINCIYGGPCP